MKPNESTDTETYKIISYGVACHCLAALNEIGLLSKLDEDGYLDLEDETLDSKTNEKIRSICTTLAYSGMLSKNQDRFILTHIGQSLLKKKSLITIFFNGYKNILFDAVNCNAPTNRKAEKRRCTVAEASSEIFTKFVSPTVSKYIESLPFRGRIADLGCGNASALRLLCEKTNSRGIGFEINKNLVREGNKISDKFEVIEADITDLDGIWDDVEVVLQSFVFHDFVLLPNAESIFSSYLKTFPRLKKLIYIDIVSPSPESTELFPGYDYIHGIQGIRVPTYEQTLDMFKRSKFEVNTQIKVEHLPSTFIWILSPQS